MPFFIAYDSANDRMYATNFGSSTASAIDTTSNTVIDTDPSTSEIDPITVGTRPVGIAYDSINENMYMTNFGDFPGSVSVIDTTTNTVIDTDPSTSEIDPIAVGSLPTDIAYDPINQDIYVTNQGSGSVSVIDTTTNTEIETITVGDTPIGIDYDPINHRMYVTNSMDGTVSHKSLPSS